MAPDIKAKAKRECPKCGAALGERAVLCVGCGYHLQQGVQLKTQRVAPPPQQVGGQPEVSELHARYDQLVIAAWISLTVVIVLTLVLNLLPMDGYLNEEFRGVLSQIFRVFPGCLVVIPMVMLVRSRRRLDIANRILQYHTLLGTSRISLSDVQQISWRAGDYPRVRLRGRHSRVTVPYYGLHKKSMKTLTRILRYSTSPSKQTGWNEFLYVVGKGRLSEDWDKSDVQSDIQAPAESFMVVAMFLLVIVRGALWTTAKVNPLMGILVVCAILILLVMTIYVRSTRKQHIKKLAAEYVRVHGDEWSY